tara:strand:- start:3127 stop:4419 length:1293 start_codon:yes stop_codon:yes gene_type:complete
MSSSNNTQKPSAKEKAIFGLNWISNVDANMKDSYANLLTNAQQNIPKAIDAAASDIGSWEVAWGPMIYSKDYNPIDKDKKIVVDNLMYVAKGRYPGATEDMYVIAISGTNPLSVYGWFTEDFNVNQVVPWSGDIFSAQPSPVATCSTSSTDGCISIGTYIGLDVLLNKMPQTGGQEGDSLVKWLQANAGSITELAVAGHSLAGTLTPVLGLWLIENRTSWNTGTQIPVSAYPTAGATPGNNTFATYAVTAYANQGGELAGYYNLNDMVPHGWQKSMLEEVPTLYTSSDMGGIKESSYIDVTAEAAINMSANIDYQRFSTDQGLPSNFEQWKAKDFDEFVGFLTVNSSQLLKLCPAIDLTQIPNYAKFLLEAGLQHTLAYFQPGVMDMEDFHQKTKDILSSGEKHLLMDYDLFIDYIDLVAKWKDKTPAVV